MAGDLRWRHDLFEVRNAAASPYGGEAGFDFTMAPLGASEPGQAAFDVRYAGIGLAPLARALEVRGLRPTGRASGRNRLEWPIGRFADFAAEGAVRLAPPAGVRLAGPEPDRGAAAGVAGRRGRPPDLTTRTFDLGGQVGYRATGERLELEDAYVATPSTPHRVRGAHRVGGGHPHRLRRGERELAGERPPDGRGHDRGRLAHHRFRGRRLRHPRRRASRRPRVAARRGDLRRRGRAGLERRLGHGPRRVRGGGLVSRRHRRGLPPGRQRHGDRRAVRAELAPARRRRGDERARAARVVPRRQHPGRVRADRGLPDRRAGHRRDAALRGLPTAVRGGAAAARPADRLRRALRLRRRRPALRRRRRPAERARHPQGRGLGDGGRVHRVGRVVLVQSRRPRRRRRLARLPARAAAAPRPAPSRAPRPGSGRSTTPATRSGPPSATCASATRRSDTSPAGSTSGTGISGSTWRGRRRPSRSPRRDA